MINSVLKKVYVGVELNSESSKKTSFYFAQDSEAAKNACSSLALTLHCQKCLYTESKPNLCIQSTRQIQSYIQSGSDSTYSLLYFFVYFGILDLLFATSQLNLLTPQMSYERVAIKEMRYRESLEHLVEFLQNYQSKCSLFTIICRTAC